MVTTIATWSDVAPILAEGFEIASRGDDWIEVAYAPDGHAGREPPALRITRIEALGQAYLAITANALAATDLAPQTALAINRALPIGSLEIEDDRYYLRATVPLLGLSAVTLRRIVLHIHRQVVHMQTTGRAHQNRPAVFLHYVE